MNTAKAAVSVMLNSLASLGVRLVTLSVLARLLSPESFGVVAMAIAVQAMVSLLAQMDIRDALIQARDVSKDHIRTAWELLIVSSILAYALVATTGGLLEGWLGIEGLGYVLRLIGLLIFFDLLLVPVEAMLIRRGAVKAVARSNVFGYALGFGGIGIAVSWAAPGATSLSVAWLALGAVRLAASVWQLRKLPDDPSAHAAISGATRRGLISEVTRFAVFGTANRFFTTSAKQIDNVVVGSVLGSAALGFYSRAFSISDAPINTLLGMTIRSVVFPSLARINDDPDRLADAATRAFVAGALLIMPLAVALSLAGPEIVLILLGPGWEQSIFPFQCLTLALGLAFGPRLTVAIGRAVGRQSILFWMNFGMTIALVVLVWLGAKAWGINGAALAFLAAAVGKWIVSIALACYLSGARAKTLLRMLLRPTVLTLALAAVFWAAISFCRAEDMPDLVTLLVGGGAILITGIVFILALPNVFLGKWERGLAAKAAKALLPTHRLSEMIVTRLKG